MTADRDRDHDHREFLDDLPADLAERMEKVLVGTARHRRQEKLESKRKKRAIRPEDLPEMHIEQL